MDHIAKVLTAVSRDCDEPARRAGPHGPRGAAADMQGTSNMTTPAGSAVFGEAAP